MQYHTLKALKKYCNEEIYLTITSCFPIYLTVEPIFEDHLLTSYKKLSHRMCFGKCYSVTGTICSFLNNRILLFFFFPSWGEEDSSGSSSWKWRHYNALFPLTNPENIYPSKPSSCLISYKTFSATPYTFS